VLNLLISGIATNFNSIKDNLLGLSPYILLVEININFAPGEYNLVNSSMCKVPTALILKSLIILDLAQSWDG
jgi:hypothetical protein